MIPYVSQLLIYPIKSLNSLRVDRVKILPSGALAKGDITDRQFAIFDQSGKFVNGKSQKKIHQLQTEFDLNRKIVFLGTEKQPFHLETERKALESWLGEYFGFPVVIKDKQDTGFPDDTISPGPTLISTATLETVASWYENLSVSEVRDRFRANIEIGGVPPFWEDTLVGKCFGIGNVQFRGINPCQRCVVVTRDAHTGEADPDFQRIFIANREKTLPAEVERSQFNHFFRLAINTRIEVSQVNSLIALGDIIRSRA